MKTEIEAKFLNLEISDFKKKLRSLGASQLEPERLMRRRIFDFPDGRLDDVGGWVRLRDEGDKTTLSYKQQDDDSLHGTKEVTIVVDNFENASILLKSIGLSEKSYQETKRESWLFKGVEIEIDTWPWAPSFVEVESPTEKALTLVLDELGLNLSDAFHGGVAIVYRQYYNVTESQVNSMNTITFDTMPAVLMGKLKSE